MKIDRFQGGKNWLVLPKKKKSNSSLELNRLKQVSLKDF